MRFTVLAAAAALMAGPAFAQSSTTTQQGSMLQPNAQNLATLQHQCQQGNQQACQHATQMRAALEQHRNSATGGTTSTMPQTGSGHSSSPKSGTTPSPSR